MTSAPLTPIGEAYPATAPTAAISSTVMGRSSAPPSRFASLASFKSHVTANDRHDEAHYWIAVLATVLAMNTTLAVRPSAPSRARELVDRRGVRRLDPARRGSSSGSAAGLREVATWRFCA